MIEVVAAWRTGRAVGSSENPELEFAGSKTRTRRPRPVHARQADAIGLQVDSGQTRHGSAFNQSTRLIFPVDGLYPEHIYSYSLFL